MTKILDRYIFKSLLGPFIFGVFSFFIIMAIDPLYDCINYIISQKRPADIVFKWFMYKMLSKELILVFPMSVLLSTLITMGGFSKNSEVIAMKSGGISFFRLIRPVIVFSALISILTFMTMDLIVPRAIEQEDLYKKFKLLNLPRYITKENVFLREDRNEFLYIGKINFHNRRFEYLMLYYFDNEVLSKTLAAPAGFIDKDEKWHLKEGSINHFDENGLINQVEHFSDFQIELNNSLDEIENFDKEDPEAMKFMELYNKIHSLSKHGVLNLNKYIVALYQKTAMPFSCIVFAIIGAAMGTTSKRTGTFTNLGLSVIMIFIYYVLLSFLKSYGVAGRMTPILASWLPNIIFFFFGAYLVTKVKN
ncbi:MAG: LptF/LptG family permease [Candidatus Muiribacteriota bacterium]